MSFSSNGGLFLSIEFRESRKRSVWISLAAHVVLFALLLAIPFFFTDRLSARFDVVTLVPPGPAVPVAELLEPKPQSVPRPPQPEPVRKPILSPPPARPLLVELPQVKLPELPKLEPARIAEEPKVVEVKPTEVVEREKPALPKAEVHTGVFSTPGPALAKPAPPAARVQTGGFGDPNGIMAEGKSAKAVNIASLGSFDLPAGSGVGNGSGSRDGKGLVASSGFGNASATTGGNDNTASAGRTVREGGFGDTSKPEASRKRVDAGPLQSPVEILSKPKPDYNEEARKLKLEGEVLLRILFTASGEVRLVEITRGLGHGLDENAVRAAQQIKFKPAMRDGQPVDSMATVHIVFQLAY